MAKSNISTQEHLPFTAVFQDVLVLKNGNFRQIVLVSSINFGLKNEDEQNAIVYSYQSFLNALTFPAQILVQSRQIDLEQYINNLKQQVLQQSNELIRYQTQEYIDFISRLISVANIMDKKFFVVVPYQKTDIKHGLFAPNNGNLQVSISEFNKIKEELGKRVEVVQQGLSSMGLKSVVLTTEQIIELLYSSYNVTQSLREKLQNAEMLADATVLQQDTLNGKPAAQPAQQAPQSSYQVPIQTPATAAQPSAAPQPATVMPVETVPQATSTTAAQPTTPQTNTNPMQSQTFGSTSGIPTGQSNTTNNIDGIQPIKPIQ